MEGRWHECGCRRVMLETKFCGDLLQTIRPANAILEWTFDGGGHPMQLKPGVCGLRPWRDRVWRQCPIAPGIAAFEIDQLQTGTAFVRMTAE